MFSWYTEHALAWALLHALLGFFLFHRYGSVVPTGEGALAEMFRLRMLYFSAAASQIGLAVLALLRYHEVGGFAWYLAGLLGMLTLLPGWYGLRHTEKDAEELMELLTQVKAKQSAAAGARQGEEAAEEEEGERLQGAPKQT